MAGDEQPLGPALVEALAGREPADSTWKTGDGISGLLSGQGSQNIPLLRWAVRYLRRAPGADAAWRDKIFPYERATWMGTEVWSRIYCHWCLMAVGAVGREARARGEEDLFREARDWILFWACLGRLGTAPSGRILQVGMRSAGHRPSAGVSEWLYALVLGGDLPRWEAACRQAGVGLRNRWWYEAALELQPFLKEIARPAVTAADPLAVLPRLGLRTGLRFRRTASGLAVWLECNANANTGAVMAGVEDGGQLEWLPADGGPRVRQKFDGATCAAVDAGLQYRSKIYGDQSARLPGGDVLYDVRLPLGDEAQQPDQTPSHAPPPPPPPVDADRAALAQGIRDLVLARKQRPLQQVLADQVLAGIRPGPEIAADLATFGIGPGQEQFPVWQNLIAEVRALPAKHPEGPVEA